MPIIKSAKKRVRTAKKATVRNAKTKKGLRGALKAFHGKITGSSHSQAQSALDKAAKKGVISKNKAARRKSQLAKKAKAAGAKPAASTKKATPAKKAAPAKKVAAKKPVAKKAPAKKVAAKKK
jgi:DNA-binding protein HU-beta